MPSANLDGSIKCQPGTVVRALTIPPTGYSPDGRVPLMPMPDSRVPCGAPLPHGATISAPSTVLRTAEFGETPLAYPGGPGNRSESLYMIQGGPEAQWTEACRQHAMGGARTRSLSNPPSAKAKSSPRPRPEKSRGDHLSDWLNEELKSLHRGIMGGAKSDTEDE